MNEDRISIKKKKPKRRKPCLYCEKFLTKVERHIITVHKREPDVQQILILPRKQQIRELVLLRRKGVYQYNQKHLRLSNPKLERDRVRGSPGKLVMCTSCKGLFKTSCFYLHRRNCHTKSVPADRMDVKVLHSTVSMQVSDRFRQDILSNMRDDQIGQICKTDPYLVFVGSCLYDVLHKKPDKKVEVRRGVRSDMRRLGKLFLSFRRIYKDSRIAISCSAAKEADDSCQITAADMLTRDKFFALRKAFEECTTDSASSDEDNIKAGLKVSLFYLVKKCPNMYVLHI